MLLLSHPTGNTFVRALLAGLERAKQDYLFYTTLAFELTAWWRRWLPAAARRNLDRRTFSIPPARCRRRPSRELGRLLFSRFPPAALTAHERGPFCVDAVYHDLDAHVARELQSRPQPKTVRAVYAYEDGARDTFAAAASLGLRRYYELPIAYWETSRALLREEAVRWPEWEPTLLSTRDSPQKQERKTRELELAEVVICPSAFVLRSLPNSIRSSKHCMVSLFGSPSWANLEEPPLPEKPNGQLRVLFAGSMSQRKGLADVFEARRLLGGTAVELVVMGAPLLPLEFYRRQCPTFTYEPPRPHAAVLELMRRCDVLVLPSIVEGRALVQQEALSCGLPLIVTPNAGGEDLVEPGQTGFLVPIRHPELIAERIAWFADHRAELAAMRECARRKAVEFTWERYAAQILSAPGLTSEGMGPMAEGAAAS